MGFFEYVVVGLATGILFLFLGWLLKLIFEWWETR